MDTTILASNRCLVPQFVLSAFIFVALAGCSNSGAAQSSPQSSAMSSAPAQSAGAPSAQPAAAAASGAPAQAAASPEPMASPAALQEHLIGVGSATVITVHGTIVSVNRAKKLVTLQGPGGKKITLHVYNPYNLAAAKAGEPFVAKFYEIATIQKLPPGQSPPSPTLTAGIVSAAPGQTPGAAFGGQLQF